MGSKKRFIYLLLLLLTIVERGIQSGEPLALLRESNDYFDATLYDRAALCYQEYLKSVNNPDVRFRLSLAYIHAGKREEAAEQLKKTIQETSDENIKRQSLFHLGCLYRQSGKTREGIECLEECLSYAKNADVSELQRSQLELGILHYLDGSHQKARNHLNAISPDPDILSIYCVSRLYLARLAIKEEMFEEAEKILLASFPLLPSDDLLAYEWHFLFGEVQHELGNFMAAAEHFESSLPSKNQELAGWVSEAWYRLGLSCLKEVENLPSSSEKSSNLIQKARNSFYQAFEVQPIEKNRILLAKGILGIHRTSKHTGDCVESIRLLENDEHLPSLEGKIQALLLLAEASKSIEEREKILTRLGSEQFAGCPHLPDAYRTFAKTELQHARDLAAEGKASAAKAYRKSSEAFKRACQLQKDSPNNEEKKKAADAFNSSIKSLIESNCPDCMSEAVKEMDYIMNEESSLIELLGAPDEVYYNRGVAGAWLASLKEDPKERDKSIKKLQFSLKKYPKGNYAPQNLLLLGTLQMQAEHYQDSIHTLQILAETLPESELTPRALFLAARSAEKARHEKHVIHDMYMKASHANPKSPLAAEAYFRAYSFQEYLQGSRPAIKHLQSLKDLFPKTPFLVNAYYLIGMDYKRDRKTPEGKWIRKRNLNEAIEHFLLSEAICEELAREGAIPKENLSHYTLVKYQSVLERALANLSIAKESQGAKKQIYLEYAEEILKNLQARLEDPKHPEAGELVQGEAFPKILEECCYSLAETYIEGDQDIKAEAVLKKMMDKYHSAKITRGYFFALGRYRLAKLAKRQGNYTKALEYLDLAEDSSKGNVLSTERRLKISLLKSECYKALGEVENAMLVLSKVINENSISSLRLKAMYLRADLYEKQGRKELARKQLEAISTKGGEWAQKAKSKLEGD